MVLGLVGESLLTSLLKLALSCNGVTQMVMITRYIGVLHTERDQYH